MSKPGYIYDWAELAFGSKSEINALKAVFIAAPREISAKRLKELIKTYLPQGNIVLGLAKEDFVLGFEGQPQFKMLKKQAVNSIVEKVNSSGAKHNIYILEYHQRETVHIFDKLKFKKIVLVNGSWKYAFHTQKPYYVLANNRIDYEMVSPFCDEVEAKEYEARVWREMDVNTDEKYTGKTFSETKMLDAADTASGQSFDNSFQTGVSVGKQTDKHEGYLYLLSAFNKVVPYQTYAWHHGASREKNFSPPNDLNHYDTVHAEVEVLVRAQKEKIDLSGTTVFINLLPCPTCCRMLMETDISEIVYHRDHSDGYTVRMLEKAGKKVRRVVKE